MENPGDEGNLVQEAEILKAFSIVAGVRCEGRRLTLMPRLPWLWDTMECVDWPVTDADGGRTASASPSATNAGCAAARSSWKASAGSKARTSVSARSPVCRTTRRVTKPN